MGFGPPGRFVPVAEESGLIIPISLWVLQEACRQHRSWRRAGYPPVKIAVNISATQFMRSNLAEKVAEVLAAYEMEARYLEVELTEGVLMRDAADSAGRIAELRALGVRISIDDFGTGYSSLGYLQRLPIDDLKIDKCFVQGIDRRFQHRTAGAGHRRAGARSEYDGHSRGCRNRGSIGRAARARLRSGAGLPAGPSRARG